MDYIVILFNFVEWINETHNQNFQRGRACMSEILLSSSQLDSEIVRALRFILWPWVIVNFAVAQCSALTMRYQKSAGQPEQLRLEHPYYSLRHFFYDIADFSQVNEVDVNVAIGGRIHSALIMRASRSHHHTSCLLTHHFHLRVEGNNSNARGVEVDPCPYLRRKHMYATRSS